MFVWTKRWWIRLSFDLSEKRADKQFVIKNSFFFLVSSFWCYVSRSWKKGAETKMRWRDDELISGKEKVRHVVKEKYHSLYYRCFIWASLKNRAMSSGILVAVSLAPNFRTLFVFCRILTDPFWKSLTLV